MTATMNQAAQDVVAAYREHRRDQIEADTPSPTFDQIVHACAQRMSVDPDVLLGSALGLLNDEERKHLDDTV